MSRVTVHRSSAQHSALAGLDALTVSAVPALISALASSLLTIDDDTDFHISSDIVIKEDNMSSVKLTMSESGSIPALSKNMCDKDSPTIKDPLYEDLKAKFVEKDGTRTCTMEGTDSISTSSKNVKHEGDKYVTQMLNFDNISDEDVTEISQPVTFLGEITETDDSTVEGVKVPFKNNDRHEVKGKDEPPKSTAAGSPQSVAAEEGSNSTPAWIRSLIGSSAMAIVDGAVDVLVMDQRKKKQSQPVAYAAAAQVYNLSQALSGQPIPQPFQSAYVEPAIQPYQPGYTKPYQPDHSASWPYQQAQPYQPPYTN